MTIWEREKERQKLWQLFERGKHVALFAPRRLGKTWLMRKLEEDAKARNITAVFVDLEAETTALGAVRRICKEISEKKFFLSLWQQLGKRVTDILQGDTPANTYQELLLKSNWESMLNATLKALNSADRPSLILIDEISVCLSSLLAVDEIQGRAFMRRLRSTSSSIRIFGGYLPAPLALIMWLTNMGWEARLTFWTLFLWRPSRRNRQPHS